MKKVLAMVTSQTENALIEWAHSLAPGKPRPSLDEAATIALDEFGRERRELRQRFADAARKVERRFG